MPKGRNFAPCLKSTGSWYKHHTIVSNNESDLETTKIFVPELIEKRFKLEWGQKNLFSKHDNRHLLQEKGEYFGQGLGKKLMKDRSQHQTQVSLKFNQSVENDASMLKSLHCQQACKDKEIRAEACRYRQFPRIYEPQDAFNTISTTTTKWWPKEEQSNYKTNTQVLAITQEVPSVPNNWKYSYQSVIFPFIATKRLSGMKRNFS